MKAKSEKKPARAKKPTKGKKVKQTEKKATNEAKRSGKAINESRQAHGMFGDGNQFWQIRSKHGRDRLFATPELLSEAITGYFEWCIANPLIEVVPFHSQGVITMANVPKQRVFTIQGLCSYLECNVRYFNDFQRSLSGKTDKLSSDFSIIITRAIEIIYNQKFTGAASGFFNPNIIARDLGLKEQTELSNPDGSLKNQIKVSIDALFPDASKDE